MWSLLSTAREIRRVAVYPLRRFVDTKHDPVAWMDVGALFCWTIDHVPWARPDARSHRDGDGHPYSCVDAFVQAANKPLGPLVLHTSGVVVHDTTVPMESANHRLDKRLVVLQQTKRDSLLKQKHSTARSTTTSIQTLERIQTTFFVVVIVFSGDYTTTFGM
jgi:hypothetical protein